MSDATAKPKIIAVMPAYNAAATLEKTVRDIPAGSVDEIILVDDCSSDNTVETAQALGLTVIRHEQNTGYGGNQKTCYTRALELGADIVVMIIPTISMTVSNPDRRRTHSESHKRTAVAQQDIRTAVA